MASVVHPDPARPTEPEPAPAAAAPVSVVVSPPAGVRHVRTARVASRVLAGRGWLRLRLALDALTSLVAALAWILGPGSPGWSARWPLVCFALLAVACIAVVGLYRRRLAVNLLDGVVPLARASLVSASFTGLLCVYLTRPVPLPALAGLAVSGFLLSGSARIVVTGLQRLSRTRLGVGRPTLIVGSGMVATRVARRLIAQPRYGLVPVGFLDGPLPADLPDQVLPVLGDPTDLDAVVAEHGIRHVVIAYARTSDQLCVGLAHRAQDLGVDVSMVPRLFDAINGRAVYETVGGLPILGLRLTRPHGRAFAVKHVADRVLALGALLLLSPLMGLVAALVKASSPGPVIFRQRRVGRDGRPFDLMKFRSMSGAADATFVPAAGMAPGGVEGIDRRTPVGRLLRRTSLDELPQLVNVLRGEMSLVGPRPERPELSARYADDLERYPDRLRVRSGITGLAQVHGLRGKTSLADRIELDNAYIEHWSLGLDLKVLLMTVVAVLRPAE